MFIKAIVLHITFNNEYAYSEKKYIILFMFSYLLFKIVTKYLILVRF